MCPIVRVVCVQMCLCHTDVCQKHSAKWKKTFSKMEKKKNWGGGAGGGGSASGFSPPLVKCIPLNCKRIACSEQKMWLLISSLSAATQRCEAGAAPISKKPCDFGILCIARPCQFNPRQTLARQLQQTFGKCNSAGCLDRLCLAVCVACKHVHAIVMCFTVILLVEQACLRASERV